MPRTKTHAHLATSYQQKSCRIATKRRRTVTPPPSPLTCQMPKSTDPYSSENLLATLEKLRAESVERIKRSQQLECVKLAGALVDFFGDQVIFPNLSKRAGNWHYTVRNQLQLDNINRDRSMLVKEVEQIAKSKGLTEKQWECLIYLALSMGQSECMDKVTTEHLNKVCKMSSVLECEDQQTVCALIDAIHKHMETK